MQDRFLDLKRKMVLHERNAVDAERKHGLVQLSKKQLELDLAKVSANTLSQTSPPLSWFVGLLACLRLLCILW